MLENVIISKTFCNWPWTCIFFCTNRQWKPKLSDFKYLHVESVGQSNKGYGDGSNNADQDSDAVDRVGEIRGIRIVEEGKPRSGRAVAVNVVYS